MRVAFFELATVLEILGREVPIYWMDGQTRTYKRPMQPQVESGILTVLDLDGVAFGGFDEDFVIDHDGNEA